MNKVSRLSRQFISNLKTHQLVTDNKRNLILSILKSTTTKREARNYLEKYENQFDANSQRDSQRDIYISRFLSKSVNPFGGIYESDGHRLEEVPLRIAIFRIKPAGIAIREWSGIRETLKRLLYLGINPVILLDYDNLPGDGELPGGGGYIDFKFGETYMMQQGNIISQQLGKGVKTTVLRSLFSKSGEHIDCSLEQILVPLYQQIIPVIQPIVYNSDKCVQEFGKSNTLLSEITLQLLHKYKRLLSIEKVVMVDALGGIPSVERNQTSHVFINLSQEYADIVSELYIGYIDPAVRDMHLHNLHTMNKVLSGVSHESGNDDTTGIITTPQIMSINDDQLNPIIYNVLTDRPVISSSLPSSNTRTPKLSTSILKKGIDVHVWDKSVYPHHDGFTIENLFKHNIVDREKFVSLINDSFGKELQVEEYFSRINETVGTVIILGDYDGAAVITYEKDIPYLDKFAIAKRNQGLPGLADIIFKIILQSHPQELIWRSRKNNPVNKWYFDRCYGSLSLPESQWKIFYTGEIFDKKINKFKKKRVGGVDIGARLHVYSDICEGIPASFGSKI